MPFLKLRRLVARPVIATTSAAAAAGTAVAAWAVRLARRVIWPGYDEAVRRGIFVYWNGSRWSRADPSTAWGALVDELGGHQHLSDLLQRVTTPAESERYAAAARLADAVCKAFKVAPAGDEDGLTVVERVRLAVGFLEFMAGLAARNRGAA